ncbi:hypothetical protein [Enterococcus sp. DIV0756]|uniref:hypothetical protein n=1 Tax=Enterococcus sp. DIV0756 TaxID=2774636 RepID=UPI003F284EA3
MKKRMIGTVLLSLLALGVAGTVQAEETNVEYEVKNSYTLKIPASIDLQQTQEIELGTSEHNIEPSKKLSLTLSMTNPSIDDSGTITLTRQKDPGSPHTLTTQLMKDGGTPLKKGDLLLKATGTNETGSLATFKFEDLVGEKKAGQYKTTITFVAEIATGI